VARFQDAVRALSPLVSDLLGTADRDALYSEVDRLVAAGLPRELSVRISELLNTFQLLDVVEIAIASSRPADEVAQLHFALTERFSVDAMLTAVTALPRADRWTALARAALRHDVYGALSAITSAVLRSTDSSLPAIERIAEWEAAHPERVARTRSTLAEALSRPSADLATLSVASRVLRALPA